MSEPLMIVVEKVFTKDGEKNGKPWRRFDVKVMGQEKRLKTFKADQGNLLLSNPGRTFEVRANENEYGFDITSVRGPLDDAPLPELTQEQHAAASVASAPPPDSQIAREKALEAAVRSMSHTVATSATPKSAYMQIVPLADAYLKWLEGSPAVDAPQMPAGDEDIPF